MDANRFRPSPRKALRAFLIAPVVLMATVALTACVSDADDSGPSTTPRPAGTPTGRPSGGPTGAVDDAAGTPIVLEIDGQQIGGRLDDSPTAASLAARLPLTLTFDDHGGQEKYAELPEALDLTGAPQSSDAQPLQIGYYAPDQRIILYYAYVGSFSGIVPIGSYDSADAVQSQTEAFTVSIRLGGF